MKFLSIDRKGCIKSFFILSIYVIIFSMMVNVSVAWASSVYYVAKNGSDTNPGTESQPWLTLQKAAGMLRAGDTVYVRQGTYREQLYPAGSGTEGAYITYASYPGEEVTIDGSSVILYNDFCGLIYIYDKKYIRISGFHVINSGPYEKNAGIMIFFGNHIIVENNHTYNTVSSGIGVRRSSSIVVSGNEVELACNDGSQECISIAWTDDFEVKNNYVHHSGPGTNGGEGIDVKEGSSNGKVFDNRIHDIYRLGLYVDAYDKYTYNIDIFNNNVTKCKEGIDIASEAAGLLENIKIYNNVITYNRISGICVSGYDEDGFTSHPMRSIHIVNNTICRNGVDGYGGGINLTNDEIENLTVVNNILSQNKTFQIKAYASIPASSYLVDYNLIDGYRNYPTETYGSNYVSGDPKFLAETNEDYRLSFDSPAIDTGYDLDVPDVDFLYNNRPQGLAHDMGAYEYMTEALEPEVPVEEEIVIVPEAPPTVNYTHGLIADFGFSGTYLKSGSEWIHLSMENNRNMVVNNGRFFMSTDDGIFRYTSLEGKLILGISAESMVEIGNVIYADLGYNGVWLYDENDNWTKVHDSNPSLMKFFNGQLAASFSSGLYLFDGSSWKLIMENPAMYKRRLKTFNTEDMVAIGGQLSVDFGSIGIWTYDSGTGSWAQISTSNPYLMGSFNDQLVVGMSRGTYIYRNSSWTRITSYAVQGMVSDGSGLFVDLGTNGIWEYDESGQWQKVSSENPTKMERFEDTLVVSTSSGLWILEENGWTKIHANIAEDMIGF